MSLRALPRPRLLRTHLSPQLPHPRVPAVRPPVLFHFARNMATSSAAAGSSSPNTTNTTTEPNTSTTNTSNRGNVSEAPVTFHGHCTCNTISYTLTLPSPSDARTSLCHCTQCKRFTGGAFGITTKVPWDSYRLDSGGEALRTHKTAHGVTREFCGVCGSGVREWGQGNEGRWTYVFYGTLSRAGRRALGPRAEFWLREREEWMKDVGGEGVFRKQEIHE